MTIPLPRARWKLSPCDTLCCARRAAIGAIVLILAILGPIGLTATAAAQSLNMFKNFGAVSINVRGTTSLTFALGTAAPHPVRTAIAFTDNLPSGLVVATPNGLSGSCAGGTITAVSGSSTVSLSGATFTNVSNACTFSVNVTAITAAGLVNNSVQVTSAEETGNTANASITLNQGSSTTTVASSANPSTLGQSVTFTASVTGGGATPTGTVTFKDGATTLGTGTLSGGTATFSTSALTVGSHSIAAVYGGDSNYTTSTSATLTQTVNQATTTTALSSSPNPSTLGQAVTFTASVTGAGGTPTGTVTFKDGATTLGTGTLSGGTATFSTSSLASGNHSITATYSGDTNFSSSTSPPVTQTVLGNGTITLKVLTTDGDGTFAFSSPTPGLSVSLTTHGGSAQSAGVSLNPGTYTVTVVPSVGFALTSVACSDSDSTGNVSTHSATIQLSPAESVTCTFSAVNSRAKTVETIHRFMTRRNDLIMSNHPDNNRQIDRLLETQRGRGAGPAAGLLAESDGPFSQLAERVGPGLEGGDFSRFKFARSNEHLLGPNYDADMMRSQAAPFSFMGSSEGPTQTTFSTSLRQIARFAEDVEAKRAVDGGLDFVTMGTLVPTKQPKPFDFWVEGRYASFTDDRNRAGLDGHFGLLYLGADYVLNPSLLVGALIQFDSLRQTSQQLSSDVTGRGWMAGPYATVRLSDNVFLQGRAAWGRSSNEVSPYMTYADEFQSERWLVSSTLTGRWRYGPWQLRPSASLTYMEDVAKSYTDSLGVVIPEVKA